MKAENIKRIDKALDVYRQREQAHKALVLAQTNQISELLAQNAGSLEQVQLAQQSADMAASNAERFKIALEAALADDAADDDAIKAAMAKEQELTAQVEAVRAGIADAQAMAAMATEDAALKVSAAQVELQAAEAKLTAIQAEDEELSRMLADVADEAEQIAAEVA